MDPKQTLIDADQAVSDGDLLAAARDLRSYWDWRANGGFEPELWAQRGDARAHEISGRLDSARRQRGEL